MAVQKCCNHHTLRGGCILIGVFGILLDLFILWQIDAKIEAIVLISNGLLIVGALTGNNKCLLPSLIINALLCIFKCIVAFLFVYYIDFPHEIRSFARDFPFTTLVIFLLLTMIRVHFTNVIYSYHDNLRKEEKRSQQPLIFVVSSDRSVPHPVNSAVSASTPNVSVAPTVPAPPPSYTSVVLGDAPNHRNSEE